MPEPRRGKRRARRRVCMVKGCGRRFRPRSWRDRCCGWRCRREARRWRNWRAQKRYRKTENGKAKRREQSCRRREKAKPRLVMAKNIAKNTDVKRCRRRKPSYGGSTESGNRLKKPLRRRVGHRSKKFRRKIGSELCGRPGCYSRFVWMARSPLRKFCHGACRKAWRRVTQREARWRRFLGGR